MKKRFLALLYPLMIGGVQSSTSGFLDTTDFFKHPETTVTFQDIFEEDDVIKTVITGQHPGMEERSEVFDVRTNLVRFVHKDEELYSQKEYSVSILFGSKRCVAPQKFLSERQHPYMLQGEEEIRCPLPDNWFLVQSYQIYERPDKTLIKTALKPLHQEKILEEERSTGPEYRVCKREWDIISQWQRKKRHEIHYVVPTDRYSITMRRDADGTHMTMLSEALLGQFEKLNRVQEEPNCGAVRK